jgi:hypothetical protein
MVSVPLDSYIGKLKPNGNSKMEQTLPIRNCQLTSNGDFTNQKPPSHLNFLGDHDKCSPLYNAVITFLVHSATVHAAEPLLVLSTV